MPGKRSVEWDKSHPSAKRERQQRYRAKLKKETIAAYGGKCAMCNNENIESLELDHINGGGNKQRDLVFHYGHQSPGGNRFYAWLRKNGFPKTYDLHILCRECHDKKHGRVQVERHGSPGMQYPNE
jgi:hypothetical protein